MSPNVPYATLFTYGPRGGLVTGDLTLLTTNLEGFRIF